MTFRSALRLDAQQWRYTSLIGMLLTSVALIVLAQNYYKHAGSEAYSVGLSLVYNLIVYASFALFISLIVRISERLTIAKLGRPAWFGLHLLVSLSLVMIHMLLCNLILYAIGLSSSVIFPRFLTKYLTNVVHVHLLVYWAVVVIKLLNRQHKIGRVEESEVSEPLTQMTQFVVKHKGRTMHLPLNEVFWIEAHDHYQKLHTEQGYHLIKDSMKNLEHSLPEGVFKRAHRSYFVNITHVQSIARKKGQSGLLLELEGGLKLKVGKAYTSNFPK